MNGGFYDVSAAFACIAVSKICQRENKNKGSLLIFVGFLFNAPYDFRIYLIRAQSVANALQIKLQVINT